MELRANLRLAGVSSRRVLQLLYPTFVNVAFMFWVMLPCDHDPQVHSFDVEVV